MRKSLVSLLVGSLLSGTVVNASADNDRHGKDHSDFGVKVEHLLQAKSRKYFGVVKPLEEFATGINQGGSS